LVELLRQNEAAIIEDLELIETGAIKVTVFDTDGSREFAGRMRENLLRLQAVIGSLSGSS
jgi:hypothetical protein